MCPGEKKSPHHSRVLAGPWGCGEEPMQQQDFWQELWLVGPTLELSVSEDSIPWKGAMLEQLGNSSTWEGYIQEEFVKDFIT